MNKLFLLAISFTLIFGIAVILTGCIPQGEAQSHFNKAYVFMDMGMYRESMIELNNGAKIMENDKSTKNTFIPSLLKGIIYIKDCDYEDAEKELKRSLELNPADRSTRYLLSLAYIKTNNFDAALKMFDNDKDEFGANFVKGMIYYEKGEYAKSTDSVSSALSDLQGGQLGFKNTKDDSMAAFKKDFEFLGYIILGKAYDKLNENDEAIRCFSESEKIYPMNKLSDIYLDISTIRKKQAVDDNSDLHVAVGWDLFLLKEYDEAEKECLKAIKLNGANGLAYNDLAVIYMEKGNYNDAESILKDALKLKNVSAVESDLYTNLGKVFLKQNKFNEAKQCFLAAIKTNPEEANVQKYYELSDLLSLPQDEINGTTYKSAGDLYVQLDDINNAIIIYNKSLAIKPDYAEAINNLGYAYYLDGAIDEAISQYNKAIKVNGNYLKAYYNLAIAYKKNGQYKDAAIALNKAIAMDASVSQYHVDLAYIYWQSGDYKNARGEFEKAIKTSNNEDERSVLKKIAGVIG